MTKKSFFDSFFSSLGFSKRKGDSVNKTVFLDSNQLSSSIAATEVSSLDGISSSGSSSCSSSGASCCSSISTSIVNNEDEIREKAYSLWEAAGRPEGDGSDFWIEAQKQIASR